MKEELNNYTGRRTIDDPGRERTFSRRAANGKINVIKSKCPKCGHKKAIKYENTGDKRCTKCKRKSE